MSIPGVLPGGDVSLIVESSIPELDMVFHRLSCARCVYTYVYIYISLSIFFL